eukprot:scaffold57783_cov28-Phaeocystis_antarctica.AAC.1
MPFSQLAAQIMCCSRRPSLYPEPDPSPNRYPSPKPSPLTTHHSPLTTHHSPLTTHHSPLTTHHSPLTLTLTLTRCCSRSEIHALPKVLAPLTRTWRPAESLR